MIATDLQTGAKRTLATGKTWPDAEAIISMTVMRRGAHVEFYTAVPQEHKSDG